MSQQDTAIAEANEGVGVVARTEVDRVRQRDIDQMQALLNDPDSLQRDDYTRLSGLLRQLAALAKPGAIEARGAPIPLSAIHAAFDRLNGGGVRPMSRPERLEIVDLLWSMTDVLGLLELAGGEMAEKAPGLERKRLLQAVTTAGHLLRHQEPLTFDDRCHVLSALSGLQAAIRPDRLLADGDVDSRDVAAPRESFSDPGDVEGRVVEMPR